MDIVTEKKCNFCGETKQFDLFHRGNKCKECHKKYKAAEYQKNKEKILIKCKEYRNKNIDKVRARRKEYYAKTRDESKAKSKKWYYDNQEKVKVWSSQYYKDNTEKKKEYSKWWQKENPDKRGIHHPEYADYLISNLYRSQGRLLRYGLKVFPEDSQLLSEKLPFIDNWLNTRASPEAYSTTAVSG